MSIDCDKVGTWDTRLSYTKPGYAIRHGALNVSSQSFQALSQASSQHVYNIQVPSLQTYVDRFVLWQSTVQFEFIITPTTVAAAASNAVVPTQVAGSGTDFALAAYPLHRLTSSMLLSINDISTQLNTAQVLPSLLRLENDKLGRSVVTTPAKLDQFLYAPDGAGTAGNPFAAYDTMRYDDAPNGAFPLQYLVPSTALATASLGTGAVWGGTPSTFAAYVAANAAFQIIGWYATATTTWSTLFYTPNTVLTSTSYGWYVDTAVLPSNTNRVGCLVIIIGGVPYLTNLAVINTSGVYTLTQATGTPAYKVAVQYTFTENLLTSPFVSGGPAATLEQGMFGINNIQLTCQMQTPAAARLIRQLNQFKTISGLQFIQNSTTSYTSSSLITQFLTPPVALHIPPRSIVPYQEIVAYPFSQASEVAASSSQILNSNVITLSQIPDYLIIRVSPASSSAATGIDDLNNPLTCRWADASLPITNVNITFDNASGLLSNVPMQRLWAMTTENGLKMPWLQWSDGVASLNANSNATSGGVAVSAPIPTGSGNTVSLTTFKQTSGGELVLAFGKDITTFETLAPGVAGNFSFFMQCTAFNPYPVPVKCQFMIMAVNSGFFTSVGGQSSRTTTPLSQTDVLESAQKHKASEGRQLHMGELKRLVGSGWYDTLSNAVSKGKQLYNVYQQHAPCVKEAYAGVKRALTGSGGGAPYAQGSGLEERFA